MEKSRRKARKTAISVGMQWLIGLTILLLVSLFSFFYLMETAASPFQVAKEKAISVAKQYAQLQSCNEVEVYNGSETYYSVLGKNKENQEVVVLVPENSDQIHLYPLSTGISEEKAKEIATQNGASKIERAVVGRENGKAIWEIKSDTAYYLIEFETGHFLKKEGL